ncbi:MAG: ADP compounds hydrolase NudE [Anaerolineaceae bacterium]|nr:ADP compounds hydrolase NudE [Anaerolineaceae bacterium]
MDQKLCGDTWISLRENEQGVLYVEMDEAIVVVPVTPEGNVLLIMEPSAAYGENVLTLPAGRIESGEDAATAANRELQEEIGFKAQSLTPIGQLHPFIKYLRSHQTIFLARDMIPSKLDGDEDWAIAVEPTPLNAFETLIDAGRLTDSIVIATLYLTRRYLSANP